MSILVVEDEPFQKAFVVGKFAELGCMNVREAADGIEAMEMLTQHQIDLMFCDIEMPNMDGSQFILALDKSAQLNKRELLILTWMSAHAEDVIESHLQMARSAGFPMLEAIVKPLTEDALQSVLEAALKLLNEIVKAEKKRAGAQVLLRTTTSETTTSCVPFAIAANSMSGISCRYRWTPRPSSAPMPWCNGVIQTSTVGDIYDDDRTARARSDAVLSHRQSCAENAAKT